MIELKPPNRLDVCTCGREYDTWDLQKVDYIDTDYIVYIYKCKCGKTIKEHFKQTKTTIEN